MNPVVTLAISSMVFCHCLRIVGFESEILSSMKLWSIYLGLSFWPPSFSFLFISVFSVLDLRWFVGWIERADCNITYL